MRILIAEDSVRSRRLLQTSLTGREMNAFEGSTDARAGRLDAGDRGPKEREAQS